MRSIVALLLLVGCAAGDPYHEPRPRPPVEPPWAAVPRPRTAPVAGEFQYPAPLRIHPTHWTLQAPLARAIGRIQRATGRTIVLDSRDSKPVFLADCAECGYMGLTLPGDEGIAIAGDLDPGMYETVLVHELMHALQGWALEDADVHGHVAQGRGIFSPGIVPDMRFTPCDYAALCTKFHCPRWYPEVDECVSYEE